MPTIGPFPFATFADDGTLTGGGGSTWFNISNAASDDGSYTDIGSLGLETQLLKATNATVTGLPAGAIILLVSFGVNKKAGASGFGTNIRDVHARLVKAGAVQASDMAIAGDWPTSDTDFTYSFSGGISVADILNSGFGFALSCKSSGGVDVTHGYIDAIWIDSIVYMLPSAGAISLPGKLPIIPAEEEIVVLPTAKRIPLISGVRPVTVALTTLDMEAVIGRATAGTPITIALAPLDMDANDPSTPAYSTSHTYELTPLDMDTFLSTMRPAGINIDLTPLDMDAEPHFSRTLRGWNLELSPLDYGQDETPLTMLPSFGYDINLTPLDAEAVHGWPRLELDFGPSAKVYQQSALSGSTILGGTPNEVFKLSKTGSISYSGAGRPLQLTSTRPVVVTAHASFIMDPALDLYSNEYYYLSDGQYLLITNDTNITGAIVQDGDTEEIVLTPGPMTGNLFALKYPMSDQP